MPVPSTTFAFARSAPYLLEQGASLLIDAPIRHGKDGSLQVPTVAGSSVTITRPDGTAFVSGAAITVPSSTAEYTLASTASETLGEGWIVVWTLVIGTGTYVFRQSAYLVEYLPVNVISVVDLFVRQPELKHRVPQDQGPDGDDVGWQPQIDAAYYELIQLLIDDARRPWLVVEVTGYRKWLLVRTLQLCLQALEFGPDSSWAKLSTDLAHEFRDAKGSLKLQYSTEGPTVRRGGTPTIRLAPVGRPRW